MVAVHDVNVDVDVVLKVSDGPANDAPREACYRSFGCVCCCCDSPSRSPQTPTTGGVALFTSTPLSHPALIVSLILSLGLSLTGMPCQVVQTRLAVIQASALGVAALGTRESISCRRALLTSHSLRDNLDYIQDAGFTAGTPILFPLSRSLISVLPQYGSVPSPRTIKDPPLPTGMLTMATGSPTQRC